MSKIIEDLSEFLTTISYEDLHSSEISNAKNAILDSHAAILSGYKEDSSDIFVEWVKEQEGAQQSTILGYNIKTTVSLSAFMHGIMGHAIDYDDVFPPLRGHPSLVVYAAILSVSEFEEINGEDIIISFLLGIEVMTKLGEVLNPSHYLRGWHSTSTVGVIGAAIAVGKLYNFGKREFQTLIGLVSSTMSGIRENFGTMTKPFHVGRASRTAVESAHMVKKGITASHNTLDSFKGIFFLYSDERVNQININTYGSPWSISKPGFHIKKYPCCYATHQYIDGIEDIINNNTVNINEISKIECIGPVGSFAPLIDYFPSTGTEGKFSLEYIVSSMLVDETIQFSSFTDKKVNRKDIRKIMEKIEAKEDGSIKEDRSLGKNGYIIINILLRNQTISTKITYGKGSPKNPLTENELKEKFYNCAIKLNSEAKIKEDYKLLKNLNNYKDINFLFQY